MKKIGIGAIRIIFSLLLAIVMLMGALTFAVSASRGSGGTTTDASEWSTGKTNNLISLTVGSKLTTQGWTFNGEDVKDKAYSYGDADVSSSFAPGVIWGNGKKIGEKNYTGGIYYTINLSAEDQVRAAKGDLSISGKAIHRCQAAASTYVSMTFKFYDADGTFISQQKKTHEEENPGFNTDDYTQSLSATVPTNTASIQMWLTSFNSLTNSVRIGNVQCYLHDTTAPAFSNAYLISNGQSAVTGGKTIEYAIRFNEAIKSISASGTATINLGGSTLATSSATRLVGDTVVYTFESLPEKSTSGTVSLAGVSELKVTDHAGNAYTYSGSPSAGTIQYYKKMSVGASLVNMTMSGGTTAVYGTNYAATLSPTTGYSNPGSITVMVGGAVLTAMKDYTYEPSDGTLIIEGVMVTDEVEITASGVANRYTVTFNPNGATVAGAPNVVATYDSAMPAVTLPQKTGYLFTGYYSAASGGARYYNADGTSARNYDVAGDTALYAQWTPVTYQIRYNPNKPATASGSVLGSMENSTFTYDKNENFRQNNFSLVGWTFKGWSTTPGGGVDYNNLDTVTNLAEGQDAIYNLYAVWEARAYAVNLIACGGSGSGTITATYDRIMPSVATPLLIGHQFLGYFTEENGQGIQYYNSMGEAYGAINYQVDGHLDLYAYWKPIKYNIQMYSEGVYVGAVENVVYGSLTLPTGESLGLNRKNFDFVGWNIYDEQNWSMYNAEHQYQVGLADVDGSTVIIYAAWQEKPIHTISFDANGGVSAPSMTSAHEEESIYLTSEIPIKESYTFKGWATSADASVAEYAAGGEFTMGKDVVTLYAVWEHNPKLSYDANGGELINPISPMYPAGLSNTTLTTIIPTRVGYTFLGWSTRKNASAADYASGASFTMPEGDTTLYAIYETKKYEVDSTIISGYTVTGLESKYEYNATVSFEVVGSNPKVYIGGEQIYEDGSGKYTFIITEETTVLVTDGNSSYLVYSSNGGTGAPTDSNSYMTGEAATVSAVSPTRVGYKFLGWSEIKEATTPELVAGDLVTFVTSASGNDVVLYAVWEANEYGILYDGNTATSGGMSGGTFIYDTQGNLAANEYKKIGYSFVGWALTLSGEPVYADGANVLNLAEADGASVTLYAIWERNITEVTLDTAGGIGGGGFSVTYGDKLPSATLRAPSRLGYSFAGYYTGENGTGSMVFDKYMMPVSEYESGWNIDASTATLYAYWQSVEYTIVYMDGQTRLGVQSAKYGTEFSLITANSFGLVAPQSKYFAGWTTLQNSNMISYLDGAVINGGLSQADGGIVYLYAVYLDTHKHGIEYNANGGSNAPTDSNLYYVGDVLGISTYIPEKEGYTFAGWSYNPNSATIDFPYENGQLASTQITMCEGGITLYAVWKDGGNTLTSQIETLKGNVNTVQENLNKAQDELKKAIESGDKVLDDKIVALDKAYKDADVLMRSDMAGLKGELQKEIFDLSVALSDAKTTLQAAIDKVQSNLERAREELEQTIKNGDRLLDDKIAVLDKAYNDADAAIRTDFANADDKLKENLEGQLADARAALEEAIGKVQDNLNKAVAGLNEADGRLDDKIDAVETAYKAANAALKSELIDKIDTDVFALRAEMIAADKALLEMIEGYKHEMDDVIENLKHAIAVNWADIVILKARLEDVREALDAADALMQSDISKLFDADSEITKQIGFLDTAYKRADDAIMGYVAVVESRLDMAVGELNASINQNKSDIEERLEEVKRAYAAADIVINAEIDALKGTDSEMLASIRSLTLATGEADEAIKDSIRQLSLRLDAAIEELNNAISNGEVNFISRITAVQKALDDTDVLIKSDIIGLKSDDEAIKASVKALEESMASADLRLEESLIALEGRIAALEERASASEDKGEGIDSSIVGLTVATSIIGVVSLAGAAAAVYGLFGKKIV